MWNLEARLTLDQRTVCFASHVPDSSAVSTLAHPTYIPVESLPHAI